MTLRYLAMVGTVISFIDAVVVHLLKWSSWIELRTEWYLWLYGLEWSSFWVIIFQDVRDWLLARVFAKELESNQKLLVDEYIWRAKYARSNLNWSFLCLVLLEVMQYCLFQHNFTEHSLDALEKTSKPLLEDLLGRANGNPLLQDYIMEGWKTIFVEKFVNKVEHVLTLHFRTALVVSLVSTLMLSSNIAFEVAKQLVLRETVQADSTHHEEGQQSITSREIDDEGSKRDVTVNAVMVSIAACTAYLLELKFIHALIMLWSSDIRIRIRNFFSDKVFWKYTTPSSTPKIRLGLLYTILSELCAAASFAFAFAYRDELNFVEKSVLVGGSMISAAFWDATLKLNQYRRMTSAHT